jgi:glycosyltransferase involved in cell wall biosynthesis
LRSTGYHWFPMSPPPDSPQPLRVLFLAHYFPKPANRLMGNWALEQAMAFQRSGMHTRVISFTSWIPRLAGRAGFKPAWALCPRQHDWDGLHVEYPRWPIYFQGPLWRRIYRDPRLAERLALAIAGPVLNRAVERFRPHIVFAHHTLFNGCLARQIKARFGLPYIITDHDLDEIADCQRFPRRREVFARTVHDASTWVAVGSRMQRLIEELFPGLPLRTVHNGSNPVPQSMTGTPRPAELHGHTVVFSAGGFYPRKGFPLLIRAFASIAGKHPGALLRIAGGGSTDGPEIQRAIAETGLGPDRIQLLGLLPPEQVKQEMVWADIFALPAWDEPFGVVFLEAASAGKPLIWATDAGIADIMAHGTHGLAVPPRDLHAAADALDQLLSNPERRQRMGRAAQELFYQRFTWDANAAAMHTLFAQAVQSASAH